MSWEREDTERWLTDYPLPQDFTWKGEVVWPRYQLKHGFGQWLRTSGPYHVALRGLFALIHEILLEKSVTSARAPTPEELAAELTAYASLQGTLGIEDEDPPAAGAPEIGGGIDFKKRLRAARPGNPTTV